MSTVKTILKWFFGITFIFGGLGSLIESIPLGLIFILLGLFILPPTFDLFEKKTNLKFPSWSKWATVIVFFVFAGFAVQRVNVNSDEETDLLVQKASDFIDSNQIDSAKVYLEKAKNQYSKPQNKAIELEKELEKYQSDEYSKEELVSLTDEEFKLLKSDSLDKIYFNQNSLNKEFLDLMKSHAPKRDEIIKEIEENKEVERLAAELRAKWAENAKNEKRRKELIEKQFSSWDGSHPALSRLIEDNMRDPDSYEHIETRFRDDKNSIFVVTKFRGANGFGGMTIQTVSAKVDFNGNVLEIVSQD